MMKHWYYVFFYYTNIPTFHMIENDDHNDNAGNHQPPQRYIAVIEIAADGNCFVWVREGNLWVKKHCELMQNHIEIINHANLNEYNYDPPQNGLRFMVIQDDNQNILNIIERL